MKANVQLCSLDSLPPGADAVVVRIEGDDATSRRLSDLGFWPGARVEVLRRAPFGDPTAYRVQGYRLALRRDEARRLLVSIAG